MHIRTLALSVAMFVAALLPGARLAPAQEQRDYLSASEADKVREAMDPTERIRLFLSFASDRLKQFQYELDHPENTVRRAQRLNALLNAYSACVDEAVDRMELGVEKQEDVRAAIKAVQDRAAEFLAYLKDLAAKGPERNSYKDYLEDAIAATNDAMTAAGDAEQENAPPPVRRRPQ
jgi:hypothetical protein